MSESLTWVKSSYSSTGNCVEVAGQPGRVLIRDTKDRSGPVLNISADAWNRFGGQVKRSLVGARSGVDSRTLGCSLPAPRYALSDAQEALTQGKADSGGFPVIWRV